MHSVADDFLAKQLPHNVTWGLTMLYSLEHPSNFEDTETQVSHQAHCTCIESVTSSMQASKRVMCVCRETW